VGAELKRRLEVLADRYELIGEVRGRGLMIGIEFRRPSTNWRRKAHWRALELARRGLFAQTIVHALFHRHRILTQVSGDHIEVIKLIPPLIIGEREVDRFIAAFDDVMAEAHQGGRLTREFAGMLAARTLAARRR
jgi:4-aminobutyrate aminotransferase-like enzyme